MLSVQRAFILNVSTVFTVEAKLVPQSVPGCGQQRKILPFKWFYGGKEPADNPFLREAYEPAKP